MKMHGRSFYRTVVLFFFLLSDGKVDALYSRIEYTTAWRAKILVSPTCIPLYCQETMTKTDLEKSLERMMQARERLLSAAIAYCDGSISNGQLRAVRELLREQERRLGELQGRETPPFVEDPSPGPERQETPQQENEAAVADNSPDVVEANEPNLEITNLLTSLNQKITRLEIEFQQGKVNQAQYQAIKKHYQQQHDVASRLTERDPDSEKWRVVLEEGKTSFLLQLNEAAVQSIAFYERFKPYRVLYSSQIPVLYETISKKMMEMLSGRTSEPAQKMYATQLDDGKSLLLIPGKHTATLITFSQDPPGWQIRALREVHRNFEAANLASLERREYRALIFPDISKFLRS
jgi:hypothetical protein